MAKILVSSLFDPLKSRSGFFSRSAPLARLFLFFLIVCFAGSVAGFAAPNAGRAPQTPAADRTVQQAPPQAAASRAAAPQGRFGESLEVDVVSIEVYVTDRQGRPVQGLHREDFSMREDGKPVEVTHFFAAPAPAGPSGSPAAAEASAPGTLPDEQRLEVAVLLDLTTTTPGRLAATIGSLRQFLLTNLRPDQRVTLATYDGALHVLMAPTADRRLLQARLGLVKARNGQGLNRGQELNTVYNDMDNIGWETGGSGGGLQQAVPQSTLQDDLDSVASEVEFFATRKIAQAQDALADLALYIDTLAGLPGRKALFYVGGGMSLHPGEEPTSNLREIAAGMDLAGPHLESGERSTRPGLLREIVARANSSRVTLYTMWVPEGGVVAAINEEEPMLTLALDTGGSEAHNTVHPERFLETVQRDLASFYSLGYTPPHARDGKTHKIEVQTRDRSLKLRYRTTYRGRGGAEQVRDQLLSALLLGAVSNPLGMQLEVGKVSPADRGLLKVDLTVKLPVSQLVLLPRDGFHEGRLTLFLGARGGDGWTSEMTRVELPFRIADATLASPSGKFAGYSASLLVKPEDLTFAVGVRDEVGMTDSVSRLSFKPTAAPSPAPAQAPGDPGPHP